MAKITGMLKQGKEALGRCIHLCKQRAGERILHKSKLEDPSKDGILDLKDQGFRYPQPWTNPHMKTAFSKLQFSNLSFPFRVSYCGGRSSPFVSVLQRLRSMRPLGGRSYYVDSYGVKHLKVRGPRAWIQGPEGGQTSQRLLILVVLVGGTMGIVYVTHLETVPYTNRKHFVLISPETEKKLGEMTYREMLRQFKGKISPPYHPESIRVSRIAQRIIESAMAGIHAEDWGKLEHGGKDLQDSTLWDNIDDRWSRRKDYIVGEISNKDLYVEDDMLDQGWIETCRQEGLKKGRKASTRHLEGLQWEVVAVDTPVVNAVCVPGGKIMVFSGILKHFRADEEIATVLGHEVAHAIARHSAEQLTRGLLLGFFEILVLLVFNAPGAVAAASDILLRLPFSRKMEIEADHIGLLVMASAGYDPRVAPLVYEKLGQLENIPEYAQYLSTHPSGKRRAELLRKSNTMREAIRIYEEKIAGRQVRGFLFL